MLTPDQSHDLCGTLTVIAARTTLEQRRLQRGDVDCARTTAVLAEISAAVQDLAQQIERLDERRDGRAADAGQRDVRVIVADWGVELPNDVH